MEDGIVMVECGANEVSEEIMVEALNFGHEAIKQIIALQKELFAKIKPEKRAVTPPATDKAMAAEIEKLIRAELEDALDTKKYPKARKLRADRRRQSRSSLRNTLKRTTRSSHMVKRVVRRLEGTNLPRSDP